MYLVITLTLKVFQKTVVLNWHRCFGISPYFGHQVKSMNYEPRLLCSLNRAKLFPQNNKPNGLRLQSVFLLLT